MSGRFAVIGLTLLAFLALGAGTAAVPATATAEFRIPGLFGGKKVVKRKRHRRPAPIQPVRNPDRTFAGASAKAVSPDIAKNSTTALGIGTAGAAAAVMALPAVTRVAAATEEPDQAAGGEDTATSSEGEAAASEDQAAGNENKVETAEAAEAAEVGATETDAEGAETKTAEAESATPDANTSDADTSDVKISDVETTEAETPDSEMADAQAEQDAAANDPAEIVETATPDADTAAPDAITPADEAAVADGTSDETQDAAVMADAAADSPSAETADAEPKDVKTQDATATDTETSESDTKTADSKTADTTTSDTKTADADSSGTGSSDTDLSEADQSDAKIAALKPADGAAQLADDKPADDTTADDKSDGAKTAEANSADDRSEYDRPSASASPETKSTDSKAAGDQLPNVADAEPKRADKPEPARADTTAPAAPETDSAEASAEPEDSAGTERADAARDDAEAKEDSVETAVTAATAAVAAAIAAATTAETDETETAEQAKSDENAEPEAGTEGTGAASAGIEDASTENAGPKDTSAQDTSAREVADSATEAKDTEATATAPAESAENTDVVAGPVPPTPKPKPEGARQVRSAPDAERLASTDAEAEADVDATGTLADKASPDAREAKEAAEVKEAQEVEVAALPTDSDVTASISLAPGEDRLVPEGGLALEDGLARSDEVADVTDVARATADAPTPDAPSLDPRAYDATYVLKVSPPPGRKGMDGGKTRLAALNPGAASLTEGGPSASGGRAEDAADAVDLGPPPPPPVDPVIEAVRAKLDGPAAPKLAAADLEALKTLYGERDNDPLWVTEDGLGAKAKPLIATIRAADDWGLDADAYAVPSAANPPATDEERAAAELALSAAVLKYARDAQAGRLTPSKAHKLFHFEPKARDPKTVLTEIAAAGTPDKALLALHPQHEQYQHLQAALVHARRAAQDFGGDPDSDRKVQLIVINMERWRWLPSDLGSFHVWNNIPEFKFRVSKGGQEIYEEKSIVGQVKYATPFFSAPMRNIVFNPNWTVPPTIVREDIAPKLRGPQRSAGLFGGRESRNRMLSRYGLTISRGGKPVDADAIDWQTANVHAYTFQQDPGPHNVLGRFKFNFPNKYAIYMHDTTQKDLFGRRMRTLSHGCIRVHQPERFAAVLLREDKGWSMSNIQNVFARAQGKTRFIALNRNIPVHMTYNTAVADGYNTIREYGDVYGIDSHMARQLFKNPAHFTVPYSGGEFAETTQTRRYSESRPRRRGNNGVDNFLSGLLGN